MVFHLKKLTNVVKEMADVPIRLLFPEVCQICTSLSASSSDGFICRECQSRIFAIKHPFCHHCGLPFEGEIHQGFQCPNCHDVQFHFVFARSACVANSMMLDLLHRYKYGNARWLDPLFERLIGDAVSKDDHSEMWDTLVPMPLYSVRQRERGFNQSAILAESLSNRLQLPILEGVVKRIAPTPSQTMLNRKERASNVAGAFKVIDVEKIQHRRILLVDDVFTTGATANECARVCMQAGAKSVHVWTLARGLGPITS